MKYNKRGYGVIGIKAVMSNWNADFTGRPKTTSKGEIFGSDKAIKHPMKVMWDSEGEKVMYFKTYKNEKDKIIPKSLSERYEELFNLGVKNKTSSEDVLNNLLKCIDVINFGATFAEKKTNVSITGAVQIGQGFNIYEDSRVEVQDILSPFRNSTKDEDGASSLGTKIVCDEAHYCYSFSVNPNVYKNYEQIVDGFEGYTKEAYDKFKKASLTSATAFATNSKFGCDNEYAIFVEMKDGLNTSLPNLASFISFEKIENTNTLDLSKLENLVTKIDEIETIEIYFDEYNLNIKGFEDKKNDKVKKFNIYTKEEVM